MGALIAFLIGSDPQAVREGSGTQMIDVRITCFIYSVYLLSGSVEKRRAVQKADKRR